MTDFELASIEAFKAAFPGVENRGCFFHFSQSIYRQIQRAGFQSRYENNAEFALKMKYLPALAFVPVDRVIESFETLCEERLFPSEIDDILDYFEKIWLGKKQRSRRKNPRYPIKLWNCYELAKENIAKTNNAVEGWHRGFDTLTSVYHENIFKTIANFKREQSLCEAVVEQYLAGSEPPRKKRRYRESAERLQNLVLSFNDETDIVDYIRGIAHNLSF